MKKLALALFLFAFLIPFTMAEKVPMGEVINLGINAFQLHTGHSASAIKNVEYGIDGSDTLWVALNFSEGGFVVMSMENAFLPVLAFSDEGAFTLTEAAPATKYWIEGYQSMLSDLRKSAAPVRTDFRRQWAELRTSPTRNLRSVTVSPLIAATWNQSQYYNDLCPQDADAPYGYGGHVPCGCVALAMAMVVHYYRYPATGQGYHGYYASGYGTQHVNYGEQTYCYEAMPYRVMRENHEVAKLIYHCGIGVDMQYASDGSGAYTSDARNAMVNYFRYDSDAAVASYNNYNEWIQILKQDLDNRYPIIYAGYNDDGGHAFVCDGYTSDNYFHFNFGWGGQNNGYYTVYSDDNAATGGFSRSQHIVHNVHPPLESYPTYCQNVELSMLRGSLEDGSGPLHYQNNTNCTYILRPENGRSFFISVMELDLEDGHDYLRIWNGNPEDGGTLVASYTGNTCNPNHVDYFSGESAYITFTSDGAGTGQGWKLNFHARRHTECLSGINYTAKEGTLEDGSGDETYAAEANCYWTIQPTNASYIALSFSQFDLSDEDFVEIYDGTDFSAATCLGTFTGETLPATVLSHTGIMRLHFVSDNYLEQSGFAANWTSDGEETPNGITEPGTAAIPFFELYPNPTNGRFFAAVPDCFATADFRITDIRGRNVRSGRLAARNGLAEMDLTDLPNGIYCVFLSNGKEWAHQKLIIQK